jgi:NADH:ubiquinone reductase (H+-translocating)
MATIGRGRAVAMMRRIHLSGWIAWMAWLLVHIWYLIGFKNRLVVMINWAWSYVTYRRGARLITGYAVPDAIQALRLQSKARIQTDGFHGVDPGHEAVAARRNH